MERRAAVIALPLAVVLAVGIWIAALTKGPSDTGYVSTYKPVPTVTPTKVLIVGDGYTAGGGGVPASQTYAPLVCATLDWICTIDAQSGTGYVNDGRTVASTNSPYAARLTADTTRYVPDVVIVTGGADDPSNGVAQAAAAYFAALRSAYPKAKLVVVLPFWSDDQLPMRIRAIRQDVESAAQAAKATILPADELLTTTDVSDDGEGPSAAGQKQLATRLAPRLAAAVARG